MTILRLIGANLIVLVGCAGAAARLEVDAIANGTVNGEVAAKINERISGLAKKGFNPAKAYKKA